MTRLKRVLVMPVGAACVALGVVGCVLPILPGWPFLFIGLSILAPRTAARLRKRFNRRFFKGDTIHFEDWLVRFDVHAGFTTKSFPLVLKKTDEWLDFSNQKRFKELFWKTHMALEHEKAASGRFVILNQVHGDRVVVLDDTKLYDNDGFYYFPEADAAITNVPGLTLLVLTADCLPVFLTSLKRVNGKKVADWVGLVHAGWRGTRQKIVEKAVRILCERADCGPQDLRAAFGPCIGRAHYEVGAEFRDFFGQSVLQSRGGKLYFDLAGENWRQLVAAGLDPADIAASRICTIASNRHFYSYRKEKDAAGRTISFLTKL